VYTLTIVLFFLGIGRNFVTLILLFLFEILQNLNYLTLNGGDNLLKFILIYYVFTNSFEYFSLQKPFNILPKKINNILSNLAVLSICFHLCLSYFISSIHKLHTDVWFNGVALYYILNLDRFKGTYLNDILSRNGIFVTVSTYGTIIIELLFPILIWVKKVKPYLIISATFLHLSIYILMMLYDFEILFIMCYGFFFDDVEIKKIYHKIFKANSKYDIVIKKIIY